MEITDLTVVPITDRFHTQLKAQASVVFDGEFRVHHILLAELNQVPLLILPRSTGGVQKQDVEIRRGTLYERLKTAVIREYNNQVPRNERMTPG